FFEWYAALPEQLVHVPARGSSRFFVDRDLVFHVLLCLRKYSSYASRFCHTTDGQNVSASTHVGTVVLGCLVDLVECGLHRLFERFIDLFFSPEERVLILHPLVITHCHAASVGQNIRNQKNSFILEHAIGAGRSWTIGQLGDDLRLY